MFFHKSHAAIPHTAVCNIQQQHFIRFLIGRNLAQRRITHKKKSLEINYDTQGRHKTNLSAAGLTYATVLIYDELLTGDYCSSGSDGLLGVVFELQTFPSTVQHTAVQVEQLTTGCLLVLFCLLS